MPTLILETPRLRLEELESGDVGLIVRVLNTDGFLRHVGDRGVHDADQALAYLAEGPGASYRQNGYGLWKVSLKAGGEGVGICGLIRREGLPAPDLGYALLPGFEGQGLASEAGAAVLRHGVDVLGLDRILAIVTLENAASIRVLEKIGMRAESVLSVDGKTLQLFAFPAPA